MKKLRFAALAMLLLLSGCEKRQTQIAPESLFVLEDGVTSQGIQAGDTPEEFQEAYTRIPAILLCLLTAFPIMNQSPQ